MSKYLQRNYLIAAVVIVSAVIVTTGVLALNQVQKQSQEMKAAADATKADSATATSTPKTTTTKTTKPAGSAPQSYLDALKTYASRKVQMSHCTANPSKMTYKNNTSLMFDNRDEIGIDLRIDGKSNLIGALGYKIITFSSKTLPHTVDIDCYIGGQPIYNVASVTLVQ